MWVSRLLINNVRNHSQTGINFCPGINVIHGMNGSGKTSILESIAIAGFSKSFLPVNDSSLLKSGEKSYSVYCEAVNDLQMTYKVSMLYEPGRKKAINSSIGDNLLPRDIIGEIPAVVLSPDLKAITGGPPSERRSFIDRILSQTSRLYLDSLIDLKKCLKQRNAILGSFKLSSGIDAMLLESWTEQFIKTSALVTLRRKIFIDEFRDKFLEVFGFVSSGLESVEINYSSDVLKNLGSTETTIEELAQTYGEISASMKEMEMKRGITLFGPQKDDIVITINSGPAREWASQGQHKTLLISLKFAEFEYLKDKRRETPLILLDDIFSELDPERIAKVIELLRISSTQTFITLTEISQLQNILGASNDSKIFHVDKGQVTEHASNNL